MHANAPRMASPQLRHGGLQRRLALADHADAAATRDDVLGNLQGQIYTFLLHQTRYHGEQRAVRIEVQPAPDIGGIGLLARPVASAESLQQVRVAFGVPAFVDAIGNAAELIQQDLGPQQAIEAAALFRCGDFAGIAAAHGGDMLRIGDAGLEKRQLAVELQAIDTTG